MKTKIVVDADVLIHFSKGGCLYKLPMIFPEYKYIILDTVYNEVKSIKSEINKICGLLKTMTVEHFEPQGKMLREYALLIKSFGKGESACMSYCKFTNDVVGSSNLRDIKKYCEENMITYLTTLDFFYYAWKKEVMSLEEINQALKDIVAKGSKLPQTDISTYIPNAEL